jgi:hypothetical protein
MTDGIYVLDRMKWTERELQKYRELVCSDEVQHVDTCDGCTKTKEEITECFMDLYYDIQDECAWDGDKQVWD